MRQYAWPDISQIPSGFKDGSPDMAAHSRVSSEGLICLQSVNIPQVGYEKTGRQWD
jgi:hypothetical protein